MTPREFIKKWKPVALTERAAAQTHFIDLCALVGHDDPVKSDPTGESFAFEKGATKTGGGEGFADVWKKGFFAWEYKKKKRNLDDALAQLVRYAAALENPPLQVACDTDRIVIRTAWTNMVPKTYELSLEDLADPQKLDILRSVFFAPDKLRPKETRAGITKEAADKFSTIALRLQGRASPEDVAHFVNQLVFCFFAHSVQLLPNGLFPKLLKRAGDRPERAQNYFNQLFAAMENEGGEFDLTEIPWFNGGLFDGRRALPLDGGDIGLLQAAASLDWSQIDPTIFGTLFERFLDPEKRAQIGAHYTDPGKIMLIVEPVILRPLRAEWDAAKAEIEALLTGELTPPMRAKVRRRMSPTEAAEEVRARFLERLRHVSILDPACGSGNFLYLALQGVKDIELKANLECEALGLAPRVPIVGPEIVRGIEINPLAAELARTTIWIGDIQWRIRNGIYARPQPILRKLDTIECRDSLVTPVAASSPLSPSPPGLTRGSTSSDAAQKQDVDGRDKPGHNETVSYIEAAWPEAEFIVGNPPFLGGKLIRAGLGDAEVESLFGVYDGRVSREADLVVYWFEKARTQIRAGKARRAGLVSTNSIRGGANREVVDRIVTESRVFDAWSDEAWVVDGAAVRVSIVCFGDDNGPQRLDGEVVSTINADLSANLVNLITARRLIENFDVGFMGDTKGGSFDVPGDIARSWLVAPINPNGRPNSDVLRPWRNGFDITRRPRDMWIIDFGWTMDEREASMFEGPFGYAVTNIKEARVARQSRGYAKSWWRHERPRQEMAAKLSKLTRHIVTARVSKYRLFVWQARQILADSAVIAIAREDDTIFGLLHSRFHEAWSLRLGTWLGVGNDPRYTPTTTFETFPFPEGLTPNIAAKDYANDPRAQAIAKPAKRLDDLRNAWLNPPDLVKIEPEVVPGYPDRILPKDTVAAAKLRERTLTNLYNQRPQWLADAHRDLDATVAAAYGWPADISEEDALAKLLELNLARAGTAAAPNSSEEAEEDDK